jgi:hypothetical protein
MTRDNYRRNRTRSRSRSRTSRNRSLSPRRSNRGRSRSRTSRNRSLSPRRSNRGRSRSRSRSRSLTPRRSNRGRSRSRSRSRSLTPRRSNRGRSRSRTSRNRSLSPRRSNRGRSRSRSRSRTSRRRTSSRRTSSRRTSRRESPAQHKTDKNPPRPTESKSLSPEKHSTPQACHQSFQFNVNATVYAPNQVSNHVPKHFFLALPDPGNLLIPMFADIGSQYFAKNSSMFSRSIAYHECNNLNFETLIRDFEAQLQSRYLERSKYTDMIIDIFYTSNVKTMNQAKFVCERVMNLVNYAEYFVSDEKTVSPERVMVQDGVHNLALISRFNAGCLLPRYVVDKIGDQHNLFGYAEWLGLFTIAILMTHGCTYEELYNERCPICQKKYSIKEQRKAELCHIQARNCGGVNVPENVFVGCHKCNRDMGEENAILWCKRKYGKNLYWKHRKDEIPLNKLFSARNSIIFQLEKNQKKVCGSYGPLPMGYVPPSYDKIVAANIVRQIFLR